MRRAMLAFAAIASLLSSAWYVGAGRERPSHERAWKPDQQHLAAVRRIGDTVRIANLRDFRHHAAGAADERWTTGVYDLARLERVWFALSPFNPRFKGLAHPFLSFEFSDSQFVSVSVEARKEADESYSALSGLFRRYETMVVFGTEQDLLGLRAVAWGDPMYMYPVAANREQVRDLFIALLERAREIERTPEFYNTITNNCTTNLLEPVNGMAEKRVRPIVGVLPGYSFDAAFERGWIDTELPLGEAQEAHLMNARIREAIDEPDFSFRIRRHLADVP